MDKHGKYAEEGCFVNLTKEPVNSGKKTVFLLGDSIRAGYCEYTKEALLDIARVRYPDDNCRYTQYTYVSLGWWKALFENPESVDLVCWNNGHWDVAHWDGEVEPLNSFDEYCKMLCRIARKLKRYFPRAKITFITTTPMNPNGKVSTNPRTNEIIEKYNEGAKEVLSKEGVDILDAYAFLADKGEDFYTDYCHLTDDGFKVLGEYIADYIRQQLSISPYTV